MPSPELFRFFRSFLLLGIILLLTGCRPPTQELELEDSGRSYKTQRDYVSLEVIYRHLRKGMERSEVEELLGEPDYSPVEGQYYYSSDRRETVNRGKEQVRVSVGMVVDYRDEQGMLTEQLQVFRLGRIAE